MYSLTGLNVFIDDFDFDFERDFMYDGIVDFPPF